MNQKKLFLKNNNLKKFKKKSSLLKRINTENDNSKDKSCLKLEEKRMTNKNLSTDKNTFNSIKNNKKKIKVRKYHSPSHDKEYIVNLKSPSLTIEQNTSLKNNIQKIQNIAIIKSPKIDDIFKTLSFSNNNLKKKNNDNKDERNFSLDFSLNNNNRKDFENDKMIQLLSPISSRNRNKNKVSSLSKKRYMKKISKKNVKEFEFNFEELNQKLFKMIQTIENVTDNKEYKDNKKNEKEGFIKWDAFEKIIAEDN
jgi:hypothetical protein